MPKIHTDLLWILTFSFCGLGLLYFVFVFFFRNKLSKKASLVANKKRELAPIISQFLFHDKESPLDERKEYLSQKVEIREMIKTRFNRQVLAEILMDLQKDVSGEARHNLYELYINLGLHHDAYAKLNSWRWEVVSQGILELTQMRVEESYLFIRKFINHSRGVIRKQAQIATVSLKHEGIDYFLDTCRYRISEWQQLKLIDVLRQLEDFTAPRFKVWLTSKNKDVVLFALRLIRYYNQNDANQAIIQLIKHRNVQIRTEAIQCLKEFGVQESLDTLKVAFRRSSSEVKLSILDAIGALGSEEDIEFLKKVEYTEENFTIKSKALTAINTIDPDSIMPSDDIREPSQLDREFAEVTNTPSTDADQTELPFETSMPGDHLPEPGVSVTECVEDGQEAITNTNQTKLDFETMSKEKDEPQQELDLPALEEENTTIFDLCFREELNDILEEAQQDEEPEYLSLSFLPVVGNSKQENDEVQQTANDLSAQDETIIEEEIFRQDLDNILIKIAMKNNPDPNKTHDEIPDFLPKVVEGITDNCNEPKSEEYLKEMEVIADMIYGKTELFEPEFKDEQESAIEFSDPLLNTEVIAESVVADSNQVMEMEERAEEDQVEDESGEEDSKMEGFSIFYEMFRDFDNESKLILLDEILVVGEEKELRFLETLENDPDKRIRKKSAKIKDLLAEKLKNSKPEEPLREPIDEALKPDKTQETDEELVLASHDLQDDEVPNTSTVSKKIPLEYCFYEGVEDMDTGLFEPQFEVELEEEETEYDHQFSSLMEENDEADDKWRSFIENLLSLSPKSRHNKNG